MLRGSFSFVVEIVVMSGEVVCSIFVFNTEIISTKLAANMYNSKDFWK